MITPNSIDIPSKSGLIVENLLITHREGANGLVVLFPGSGYHCDKPLLYYAREIALQSGLDVLSLRYFFQQVGEPFTERMMDTIIADTRAALEACPARAYPKLSFVSKSLGTRVSGALAAEMPQPVRQFYLTPLLDAIDSILSTPCTVVAGSADRWFTPSLHMGLKSSPIVDLHVIPDARHSLEIPDDYRRSLEALSQVCGLLENFMRQ